MKLAPSATSGYYRLVDVRTGWCADVANASAAGGANVIQWPSTGGSKQDCCRQGQWSALRRRSASTESARRQPRAGSVLTSAAGMGRVCVGTP